MSRLFTARGVSAAIDDGGRIARGTTSEWSWARVGRGYTEGTHTWRLRVRQRRRQRHCDTSHVRKARRASQLEANPNQRTIEALWGLVDGGIGSHSSYESAHTWVVYTHVAPRLVASVTLAAGVVSAVFA